NGTVSIFGRGPGKTQIVIVTPAGQTTVEVTVEARHALTPKAKATNTDGRGETRYVSAGKQLHNNVTITREHTELRVQNVTYGETMGARATTTLPSVSYRIFTGHRELTLLDRVVDHSPLTTDDTIVRGVHYLDDRWTFHAGVTSYAAYQSFLVPSDHEVIVGAAYRIPLRNGFRLTPGAFFIDKEPIASLLLDYQRGDTLVARGELALDGGGLGAAMQLALDREHDELNVDLRYTPAGFAAVQGDPRGFFADASYAKTFAGGSTVDASVSAY